MSEEDLFIASKFALETKRALSGSLTIPKLYESRMVWSLPGIKALFTLLSKIAVCVL